MTEPAAQTPAQPTPPYFFPFPQQPPAMFANHIMVAADGVSVYITFSQAAPVPSPMALVGTQKIENLPMIATPVAKVVLAPTVLPQLIENLQELNRQLAQRDKP